MPETLPRTKQKRPRRRLRDTRVARGIKVLPTLLTLGNLLCGFAAIHYAAKPVEASDFFGWSTLTVAGTLIFFGMFFDALDGGVARLTRSTSDLGAQLDSLCDMVTFGVAPAFMMLRLVSHYYGAEHGTNILGPDADNFYAKATWTIAAVYICCTALRLARFNSETVNDDVTAHMWFRGLPSPGSAGCVASLILLHQHLLVKRYGGVLPPRIEATSSLLIPAITLLCAPFAIRTSSTADCAGANLFQCWCKLSFQSSWLSGGCRLRWRFASPPTRCMDPSRPSLKNSAVPKFLHRSLKNQPRPDI